MENFGKFWRKKMENFGKSWEFLGNFERFHALSCGKKLSPKITFVEKNDYYKVWKKRELFLTLLRSLGQLLDCGLYWCKCLVILKISSLNPTNIDIIIIFTLFIWNLLENIKYVSDILSPLTGCGSSVGWLFATLGQGWFSSWPLSKSILCYLNCFGKSSSYPITSPNFYPAAGNFDIGPFCARFSLKV